MRRARWRLHNGTEITVDYSVSPNPELGMIVIEAQALDRLLRINREEAMLSTQETSRNLIRSSPTKSKTPSEVSAAPRNC
jgi:two-component system nitrogen regulation sensor histidine kinase GlnL